jgi:hypothetical protein
MEDLLLICLQKQQKHGAAHRSGEVRVPVNPLQIQARAGNWHNGKRAVLAANLAANAANAPERARPCVGTRRG